MLQWHRCRDKNNICKNLRTLYENQITQFLTSTARGLWPSLINSTSLYSQNGTKKTYWIKWSFKPCRCIALLYDYDGKWDEVKILPNDVRGLHFAMLWNYKAKERLNTRNIRSKLPQTKLDDCLFFVGRKSSKKKLLNLIYYNILHVHTL